MDAREQFFHGSDGGYESYSHPKNFMQTWKKVLQFEKDAGKTLDEGFTREEYVALFNFVLVRCVSTFYNDKRAVLFYVRYLISKGLLPPEHDETVSGIYSNDLKLDNSQRVRYFKNLAHLRDAIEESVRCAGRIDDTMWDVPSAILYLAWYGLTEDQILSLPKSAVTDDGVMLDGELIPMQPFVTDVLTRLRDSEGFRARTKSDNGILRRYVYSEFLIRTEDSPQLTHLQMRSNLSRFGNVMGHESSLKFKTARQSGIFYRAYITECESNGLNLDDISVASKVFCEDLSPNESKPDPIKRYRERMRDYAMYKQLFA